MTEPMDNHGIDIDIVSGRPRVFPNQAKAEGAQVQYHQAIQDSWAIMAELRDSPILTILVQKYADRLSVLAMNDTECQTIEKLIHELRFKVDLAPKIAEQKMIHIMGGPLAQAYKQAKQAAP